MPRTNQPVNAAFHEKVLAAFLPGITPSIGDCQACFYSGVRWILNELAELEGQPEPRIRAFIRDVNAELRVFSKHLQAQSQKPENN